VKAVDTSVAVAAFASWHEAHAIANVAVDATAHLPAHCVLEVYATLTRLPNPHRAPAELVSEYLERRFGRRVIEPPDGLLRALPRRLAAAGVAGGATYDGLVAETARSRKALLLSLDQRAARTYRLLGVDHELLAAAEP
jgi:predicted nucleic acid-binding protein